MSSRLVLLVLLVACGGRTYTGSSTSFSHGDPSLRSSRVYISFRRELNREYDVDGGIIPSLLGVGDHDNQGSTSEVERTDELGTVVIDLRTGRCSLVPTSAASSPTEHVVIAPTRFGDRWFEATSWEVRELTADGQVVAAHRPSAELTFNARASSTAYAFEPIGVDGSSIVFYRRDLDAIVVFDFATRGWRVLRYESCAPPT